MGIRKAPKTIEEMLRTRYKNHILTIELMRDICKRIKKLEGEKYGRNTKK